MGDPDGYGEYGVLDDDGTAVLCHECGERYVALGRHVTLSHEMTVRDYKIAHGLPMSRGLGSKQLRAAQSERQLAKLDSPAWHRLERRRDPQAAADSRDETAFDRRGAARVSWEAGLRRGPRRVYECIVCGRTWTREEANGALTCSDECLRIHLAALPDPAPNASRDARILAAYRMGWSRGEISTEFDIGVNRVGQIIRKLAADYRSVSEVMIEAAAEGARRLGSLDLPTSWVSSSGAPVGRWLVQRRVLHRATGRVSWVTEALDVIDPGWRSYGRAGRPAP